MSTEYDKKFQARLAGSERARHFCIDWYRRYGIVVDEPKMEVTPNYDDRLIYTDSGDFFPLIGGHWVKMEAKRREKINFTCAENFGVRIGGVFRPFPDMIVCAKHTFDKTDQKPLLYIHLNASMSHAGIIRSNSYPRWTVRSVPDPYYDGKRQLCYHVGWKDVEFIPTSGPPPLVEIPPPIDPPCQTC